MNNLKLSLLTVTIFLAQLLFFITESSAWSPICYERNYYYLTNSSLNCPVTTYRPHFFTSQPWGFCPVDKINEKECKRLTYKEKVRCLKLKAKKGDKDAMYFLGAIYHYNSPSNDEKAKTCFKKANDGRSLYQYANMCHGATLSKFCEMDEQRDKNNYKYKISHAKNEGQRKELIKKLNEENKNIKENIKNFQKCYVLYEKSAKLGYKKALDPLCNGFHFFDIDLDKRIKHCFELTESGKDDLMGVFRIAHFSKKEFSYEPSKHTKDIKKLIKLYEKVISLENIKNNDNAKTKAAAMQRLINRQSNKAKFELGEIYYEGKLVKQDKEKGLKLIKDAAKINSEAKEFLKKLNKN